MTTTRAAALHPLEYFYRYGLYFVFGVLVLVFSLITPQFYDPVNIINILQQSAAIGIAVVGMVFVILTAGIDLSTGSTMYIAATITAYFASRGAGLIPALLISTATGAMIGALNGLVISRWRIVPFIATLAVQIILRGLGSAISGQTLIYFTGPAQEFLTQTMVLGVPVITIIFLLIIAVGQFVLVKTSFGRQLFAIGNNAAAAEKVGINVKGKLFAVYLIAGAMAGLSGLISSVQVGAVTPDFGRGSEFLVISAAVLGGVSLFGGKGRIFPGALIGVLIITCIENGLVLVGANPYSYTVVRGLVIFLAVMVDCVRNKGELR
jgi:ribose transport system permease protein